MNLINYKKGQELKLFNLQAESKHKLQVDIFDPIAHVDAAVHAGVGTVVSKVARPQAALDGRNQWVDRVALARPGAERHI